MTPRRLTAALCLVAVILLAWGAFTRRWHVFEGSSYEVNGRVLVGLTGATACATTVEASACESIEWKSIAGRTTADGWLWLGRLTFGLTIAAAVALLAIAVGLLVNFDLHSPIHVPRWTLRLTLSLLPLMGGYWMFTPSFMSQFSTGRGFLLVGLGSLLGSVAAYRALEDRWG